MLSGAVLTPPVSKTNFVGLRVRAFFVRLSHALARSRFSFKAL